MIQDSDSDQNTISNDPNSNIRISMNNIAHPTPEISYTGERNVKPPTNPNDMCVKKLVMIVRVQ